MQANSFSMQLKGKSPKSQAITQVKRGFPVRVPALPHLFTLELTTLCDNRCTGCANVEVPEQRQKLAAQHSTIMTEWRNIIDTIIKQTQGKAIIRLSGGEPTLHPEFEEIVRYLDKKNVPHALLTTGKWHKIGAKNLIELYQNCQNAVGFLVSVHGRDKATHNAFVESGDKSFEQTIKNIQLATKSGIRVFSNSVITNKNYNQIAEILDLAQSIGVEYSVFNRFLANQHPLLPTEKELLVAIAAVQKARNQGIACRIGNNIPACFYPLSNFPSVAAYALCHVSPQGTIRPDNLTTFSFGNILNTPLTELWHNASADMYRASIPTSCLQCAALQSCRGGAKSLYFLQNTPQQDALMRGALTIEQTQSIDDDKEKKNTHILALTSD